MRMHEILGVEPGEVFGYKNACCDEVKYNLDAQGNVFRAVKDYKRVPSPREIVDIINHPELIIHKPRLTAEQIYLLKALLVLGYRWLTVDDTGQIDARDERPTKETTYWRTSSDSIAYLTDRAKEELGNLVSWSDTKPFNIEQTLRDAGVEV